VSSLNKNNIFCPAAPVFILIFVCEISMMRMSTETLCILILSKEESEDAIFALKKRAYLAYNYCFLTLRAGKIVSEYKNV
jgi:hypothetical protein